MVDRAFFFMIFPLCGKTDGFEGAVRSKGKIKKLFNCTNHLLSCFLFPCMTSFSLDCRKTESKVITKANQKIGN